MKTPDHSSVFAALLALLLLAGCSTASRPTEIPPRATSPPIPDQRQALLDGVPVYRIAPGFSRAEVLVRRDGPLARFGHDHVMVANQFEGYVLVPESLSGASAYLQLELDSLEVDPPDARKRHQLDTQPDQDSIAGTRSNMLEKVLETRHWPTVSVLVESVTGALPEVKASVWINLHGTDRHFEIPLIMNVDAEHLSVEGSFGILQSEFGIAAFSILGGGLRVSDPVELQFHIEANRVTADS
jgi:hypothetical protein